MTKIFNTFLFTSMFFFAVANAETLTYQGSVDFNKSRGFSYTTSKGEVMSYNSALGNMKAASETYLLIGREFIHPGNLADAILRFTSPGVGSLVITGKVYDLDPTCGGGATSGVLVTIKKNTTILFQNTILNGNITGFTLNLNTSVVAGDKIDFIVNARGDWACDSTYLDPKIVFTRSTSSSTPAPAPVSISASTPTANLRTFLLDETNTINSWSGLTLDSSHAIAGQYGVLWSGANGGSPTSLNLPNNLINWSSYRSISFWAYSEVNNNAQIAVTLTSPNTNGNGDYYFASFFTDWKGWKLIKINFKDFRASRTPYGFQKITTVGFASKGWAWLSPKTDTRLYLDRIAISTSEKLVDLKVQAPSMTVFNLLGEISNPSKPTDPVPKFEQDYGFKPIKLALPGHRFDPQAKVQVPLSAAEVRQSDIMIMAKQLEQQIPNGIVVLDLEHWKTTIKTPADEMEVRRNVETLGYIIDWFHAAAPSLKVGYYGLLPNRDYWRSLKDANSVEYKAWQKENDYFVNLAKKVDLIFPSLYTFYNDKTGWQKYANANVSEAKRYKKPIYAFLWPQYHDSNAQLKGSRIDGDFWFLQLNTMKSQAINGLVLWDWAGNSDSNKILYWNSNEGWWQSTLRFLFP